jgi:hypothetical protein
MTIEPRQTKEIEFLRGRLKQSIDFFHRRRDLSRKAAVTTKMLVGILGAATTIALGIKPYGFYDQDRLSVAALCFSSAVPVFAAWEAFYDPRWLWVRYNETLGRLYAISDDFEYALASGQPLAQEAVDKLYARLQDVLQETNKAWSDKRVKDRAAEQTKAADDASK